jgi:hypothetical protein
MMGWDLKDIAIEQSGGLASPFRFEIVFSGQSEKEPIPLRGDGIVLRNGGVHFNNEDDLKRIVTKLGLNAQNFLDYLADIVVEQTHSGASARA